MNHVSLPTAKALQSVGFDLPTHYFYPHNPEKVLGHHDTRFYKEGEVLYSKDPYLFDGLAAPDTLEAVLWLWEKYGVLATFFVIGGSKLMFEPIICSTKFIQESGAHSRAAGEDTNDLLTAYSSAIVVGCEYIKNKKE